MVLLNMVIKAVFSFLELVKSPLTVGLSKEQMRQMFFLSKLRSASLVWRNPKDSQMSPKMISR